jgi:putative transferase (TIGR04331 family)
MFLATTALSEFWDKNQEILFLGPWCMLHDRRVDWEGLKYHVLPNPWDDRKRFYQACEYVDGCYERILDILTEYLNRVHRVSFSTRYWRVLLGAWLLDYLHAVYDRYVHLSDVFNLYPDLQTILLDPQCYRVPLDTLEYTKLAERDLYNLQLFSQLLQERGHIFPTRSLHNGWPELEGKAGGGRWLVTVKNAARKALIPLSEAITHRQKNGSGAALCFMYCDPAQTWALAWRTEFRGLPYELKREWTISLGGPVFDDHRNGLAALPSTDEFERAFIRLLPQNFPSLYLENYCEARDEALKLSRAIPAVIVSSVGWYSVSEPFKFLSAEASERGSRLVAVQHGSYYGMSRYKAGERYESSMGDAFMVWGWAEQEGGAFRNLPSPKLSSLLTGQSAKARPRAAETILFVATGHPLYLQRFQSMPTGHQWTSYVAWASRFLDAVPEKLRSAILFRPSLQDFGLAPRKQIASRFPDVGWENGLTFYQRLESSDMVVIDHPGTTSLETLVANVPVVLFWDPGCWEMRDEAEPYFEALRKAGVLWHSPEEAAAKVAPVSEDPWAWWGSEAVQEARQRFVDRYALARRDWLKCWTEALEEEIALSQANHP